MLQLLEKVGKKKTFRNEMFRKIYVCEADMLNTTTLICLHFISGYIARIWDVN